MKFYDFEVACIWLFSVDSAPSEEIKKVLKDNKWEGLIFYVSRDGNYAWGRTDPSFVDLLSDLIDIGKTIEKGVSTFEYLNSSPWDEMVDLFKADKLGIPFRGTNPMKKISQDSIKKECTCHINVLMSSGCPKIKGNGTCIEEWRSW